MKTILLLAIVTLCWGCSETTEEIVTTEKIEAPLEKVVVNDGEVIEYHDNGKPKIKGALKNGKREGIWQSFYPNGILQSENKYKKGILNGKTATYYPNGNLNYVGLYVNDKKDGTWYFYLEDGSEGKEVQFKDGEKVTP